MAASRPVTRSHPFAELDVVRLRSIVYTDNAVFRAGSLGTIVFRHPHGEAYEVELADPVAAVVTLRDGDLDAVR